MSIIYLVIGETGEYSDRSNWFVGWSHSEEVAEELCHMCSLEARKRKRLSDKNRDAYEKEYTTNSIDNPTAYDPHFGMIRSTGTRYYVAEVTEIEKK